MSAGRPISSLEIIEATPSYVVARSGALVLTVIGSNSDGSVFSLLATICADVADECGSYTSFVVLEGNVRGLFTPTARTHARCALSMLGGSLASLAVLFPGDPLYATLAGTTLRMITTLMGLPFAWRVSHDVEELTEWMAPRSTTPLSAGELAGLLEVVRAHLPQGQLATG